jgi:hypothetical protein
MSISNVALSSALAYAGAAALGMNAPAMAVSVAVAKIFEWKGGQLNKKLPSSQSRNWVLTNKIVKPAVLLSATLLGCYAGNYLNAAYKIGALALPTLAESFLATTVSSFFSNALETLFFSAKSNDARTRSSRVQFSDPSRLDG